MAYFFDSILSPIIFIALGLGPIHINPDFSTNFANFAFSDKKPYPGCMACAFVFNAN